MTKKELNNIQKCLEKIECFKNVTVDYNKEKNILDIYLKIVYKNIDFVKDFFNNVNKLDYVYCDFGVFELMFDPEDWLDIYSIFEENF